jgi:sarcosine oxidase, subunit beta
MSRTADVAVIGDGVVGASIAYHLAAAGVNVALLRGNGAFERGATANSAGQIRLHHSDPHESGLAALSLETFARWPESVGGDCGFRRTGFAFLVDEAYTGALAETVATLTSLGADAEVRSPAEFATWQPAMSLAGVAAVGYEPDSGYADPVLTTTALIDRAATLGATVLGHRHGAQLVRTSDRISGAIVDGERVWAGQVVLAAGIASLGLSAAIGIALPLSARQFGWALADTSAMPGADRLCMVIDDVAGMYFRPAGPDRLLFRIPLDAGGAAGDPDRLAEARARLAPRLPGLRTAPVLGTAEATEACTPDGRALIGPVTEHPGLYVATGFNGGGFKTAPAVGRFVAAALLSGTEPTELKPYRPDRFTDGSAAPATRRYRHS